MIAPSALALNAAWVHYVLEPAARALILAGAAWLLLTAFRVRGVSIRLAAWTTILYAALAMPFLSQIVPQVPVPVLSAQFAQQAVSALVSSKADTTSASVSRFAVFHPEAISPSKTPETAVAELVSMNEKIGDAARAYLPVIAVMVYLLVAGLLLSRFAVGLVSGRRVRRTGEPLDNQQLLGLLALEARKSGLKKIPPVAESAALSVPATLGFLRPVILLPLEWNRWSESQTRAVLAHELSHIARRDGLTQMLSRLHRALFWFSPLSWLLDRALVELAEQASDDAALRSGADRIHYAEVLLHFFRALKAAHGRVRWAGVSMAQGSGSRRRVERILRNSPLSQGLGLAALAAVALATLPLICLAAAVRPSHAYAMPAAVSAGPPPPPAALKPASLPVPVASTPAAAASVVARPAARRVPWKMTSHGSMRRSSRKIPTSFILFRENGRFYFVSDPATVKAALGALAPLENIEQRLAILDWKQEALARDQELLAMQIAGTGSPAADTRAQGRAIESQLRAFASAATPRQFRLAEAELALAEWNAMQINKFRMEFAASRDLELANRQQAALDHEQAELEKEQVRLAIQAKQISRSLIEQSFRRGLARPL